VVEIVEPNPNLYKNATKIWRCINLLVEFDEMTPSEATAIHYILRNALDYYELCGTLNFIDEELYGVLKEIFEKTEHSDAISLAEEFLNSKSRKEFDV